MFSLLLLACSEPVPRAATPDPNPTPGTPVEDTSDTSEPVDPYMEIQSLTLGAQFGYDPATGTAQPVIIEGSPLSPSFEIYLGTADWNGSLQSPDYCTIAYDMTGLTLTPNPGGSWLTATIPSDAPTTSDCHIDPGEWGDDPSEAFRPAEFSVALGPMTTEVYDWLAPQVSAAELEFFHAGEIGATDVLGEDVTLVYSSVYETDAALTVTIDADQLVPLREVDLTPTTPASWVTLNAGFIWTLQ